LSTNNIRSDGDKVATFTNRLLLSFLFLNVTEEDTLASFDIQIPIDLKIKSKKISL